jgi:KipI family sensor histidine kinase inhibitor
VNDVIALHSSNEYRVYAIGFAPGFAYLGQVDERIAAPRLATPRQRVPRGSVAIADRQTAVYPAVSPGGWNLIGRCPTRMFDPKATPVMPVAVGDKVRFEPIGLERYLELGGVLA